MLCHVVLYNSCLLSLLPLAEDGGSDAEGAQQTAERAAPADPADPAEQWTCGAERSPEEFSGDFCWGRSDPKLLTYPSAPLYEKKYLCHFVSLETSGEYSVNGCSQESAGSTECPYRWIPRNSAIYLYICLSSSSKITCWNGESDTTVQFSKRSLSADTKILCFT